MAAGGVVAKGVRSTPVASGVIGAKLSALFGVAKAPWEAALSEWHVIPPRTGLRGPLPTSAARARSNEAGAITLHKGSFVQCVGGRRGDQVW